VGNFRGYFEHTYTCVHYRGGPAGGPATSGPPWWGSARSLVFSMIVASWWLRRRPATEHACSPGLLMGVAGWPVVALNKRARVPSVVMHVCCERWGAPPRRAQPYPQYAAFFKNDDACRCDFSGESAQVGGGLKARASGKFLERAIAHEDVRRGDGRLSRIASIDGLVGLFPQDEEQ